MNRRQFMAGLPATVAILNLQDVAPVERYLAQEPVLAPLEPLPQMEWIVWKVGPDGVRDMVGRGLGDAVGGGKGLTVKPFTVGVGDQLTVEFGFNLPHDKPVLVGDLTRT